MTFTLAPLTNDAPEAQGGGSGPGLHSSDWEWGLECRQFLQMTSAPGAPSISG